MGATEWMPWVLGVVLPASVGWLALHGWRQGRRLRRWAVRRGYRVEGGRGGRVLDEIEGFESDSSHLQRDLGKVRDVVSGRGFRLFRCLETLDLSPWRGGTGPPKTRIAVLFPSPGRGDTLTVVGTDGRVSRSIPPGLRFSDPVASRRIESRLPGPPPDPVSITLSSDTGLGLAYMLTPSGTVSDEDLDYLVRLAARLSGGRRSGTTGGGPADAGGAVPSRRGGAGPSAPPADAPAGRGRGGAAGPLPDGERARRAG